MQGKMTILKVDGTKAVVDYDKPIQLDDIQKAVGGWIELVPDFDTYEGKTGAVAFCNEEGKLKNLPVNDKATEAWAASIGEGDAASLGDALVGDVVVIEGDDDFMAAL